MKEDGIIFPATRNVCYEHLKIKLGIPKGKEVYREIFDLFYSETGPCKNYNRYYTNITMTEAIKEVGIPTKLPIFLEIKKESGAKKAKEYFNEQILEPLKIILAKKQKRPKI